MAETSSPPASVDKTDMRDETALAEDESQQVEPPAYHTIEQRILARKLRGLSPPITPETYKISDKKGNKPIVLFTCNRCATFPAPRPCLPGVKFHRFDNPFLFQSDAIDRICNEGFVDMIDSRGATHRFQFTILTRKGSSYVKIEPRPIFKVTTWKIPLRRWRRQLFGPINLLPELERYHQFQQEDNAHLFIEDSSVRFPSHNWALLPLVNVEGVRFRLGDCINQSMLYGLSKRCPEVRNGRLLMVITQCLFPGPMKLAEPPGTSSERERIRKELDKMGKTALKSHHQRVKKAMAKVEKLLHARGLKRKADDQSDSPQRPEAFASGQGAQPTDVDHSNSGLAEADYEILHRQRMQAAEAVKSGTLTVTAAAERFGLSEGSLDWFRLKPEKSETLQAATDAAIEDVVEHGLTVVAAAKKHGLSNDNFLSRRLPIEWRWIREVNEKRRNAAVRAQTKALQWACK